MSEQGGGGKGFSRITRRELLRHWWVLPVGATLGALGGLGLYAGRVLTGKEEAGEAGFEPHPAEQVATLTDLRAVWDAVEFAYAGVPAILLRVPQAVEGGLEVAGGLHLVAYSRLCTHQRCPVVLVREQEVLALAYNYRPSDPASKHPQLGCPCHYSVFDPVRGGEAVFGRALKPLPRIGLEVRGDIIFAVGLEQV